MVPKQWIKAWNEDFIYSVNLVIYDYSVVKKCQLHTLIRLVSKQSFHFLPTSVMQSNYGTYFNILFSGSLYFQNYFSGWFLYVLWYWQSRTKSLINETLVFKHYLHTSRGNGTVCFTNLNLQLTKIKTIKQNISH